MRTNGRIFVAENCFLEKYEYRNLHSPRGSVINCRSGSLYAYGRTEDAQYRSYVCWKFTGILNPRCGNGSKGQTKTPNMGV
eukprot:13239022-Ditylum_brightwellii.AAC.1